jgi:hypothetical protein
MDVFIYDFVIVTKVCQGKIYVLYMNTRFKFDNFESYKSILDAKNWLLCIGWQIWTLTLNILHNLMWIDNTYGQHT